MGTKRTRYLCALPVLLLLLAGGAPAAPRSGSKTTPAKKAPSPPKARIVSSRTKKASASQGKASTGTKGRSQRRRSRRAVARGPAAPSPQRIREIQEALARSGHYRKEPTGKLDASTTAALGSFQQANGLERTGKLNAWTLRKLEQYGLPPNSRGSAAQRGALNQ